MRTVVKHTGRRFSGVLSGRGVLRARFPAAMWLVYFQYSFRANHTDKISKLARLNKRWLCVEQIYAALLLLLVEVFWFSLEINRVTSPGEWQIRETRFAAGFPIHSISYTIKQTSGNSVTAMAIHSDDIRWWPDFWFSYIFLLLDILAAFAVFLGIRLLLRFQFARTIFLGLAIGVVFGILINFGIRRLPQRGYIFEDPVSWLNGFSVFIALPTTIYFFTRSLRWYQPIFLLLALLVIFPWISFWCDQFRINRQFFEPTVERMVFEPLLIGFMTLPLIFLMRGLRHFFTKPAAAV